MEAKKKILRQVLLPEDLQRAFAGKCKVDGVLQQDVVKALVSGWVSGRLKIRLDVPKGNR